MIEKVIRSESLSVEFLFAQPHVSVRNFIKISTKMRSIKQDGQMDARTEFMNHFLNLSLL